MLGLSRGRSRRACLVAADQLAADDDAALGEADANCQRAGESRMRQRRLPSPPVGPKTVISAASSHLSSASASSRRRNVRVLSGSGGGCLGGLLPIGSFAVHNSYQAQGRRRIMQRIIATALLSGTLIAVAPAVVLGEAIRSEERRVGKECRSRWS